MAIAARKIAPITASSPQPIVPAMATSHIRIFAYSEQICWFSMTMELSELIWQVRSTMIVTNLLAHTC